MRGPDVTAQRSLRDSAFRLSVNGHRQLRRALQPVVEHTDKVNPRHMALLGHFSHGFREGELVNASHDLSVMSHTILSTPNTIETPSQCLDTHHRGGVRMRITKPRRERAWPQQEFFRKQVLAYRHAHNMDLGPFANLLQVSESHLHNLLYDYRTRPSLDVVERASGILQIPAGDLMDDRGSQLTGEPLPEMSAAKRLVAKLIIHELHNDSVSDEQALRYLDAFRAMVGTGK